MICVNRANPFVSFRIVGTANVTLTAFLPQTCHGQDMAWAVRLLHFHAGGLSCWWCWVTYGLKSFLFCWKFLKSFPCEMIRKVRFNPCKPSIEEESLPVTFRCKPIGGLLAAWRSKQYLHINFIILSYFLYWDIFSLTIIEFLYISSISTKFWQNPASIDRQEQNRNYSQWGLNPPLDSYFNTKLTVLGRCMLERRFHVPLHIKDFDHF